MTQSFSHARAILEFVNRATARNEIAVLGSEKLTDIKGGGIPTPDDATWLGFDYHPLRNWSLLRAVFDAPEVFEGWFTQITARGLFSTPDSTQELLSTYQTAARNGDVEPLPEEKAKVEAVQPGRIEHR